MNMLNRSKRFATRIGAGVATAMLMVGLVPAMAFASGTAEENTNDLLQQVAEGMADGSSSAYDYLDGQDTSVLAEALPSKLDLRDRGVVTPVKFQNPWGTCWAFGITAAAETSILSELGTTYAATGLDLSEHHLAWFAKNHLPVEGEEGYTDGNTQAGEGMWYDATYIEKKTLSGTMSGGFPYYGAFSYASGMGPVEESSCPYYGVNKWVEVMRDTTITDTMMTYDEALAAGFKEDEIRCWSSKDDWTLSESQRFQQAYVLEESNILPSTTPDYNEETGAYTLNASAIENIKSQLAQGYGVEVCYMADSSHPTDDVSKATSRYINTDNSAHFAWSLDGNAIGANHSVMIVGYDDSYAKENFTNSTIAKWDENGLPVYTLTDEYKAAHEGDIPEEYLGELPNDVDKRAAYYVNTKGEKILLTSADVNVVYECTGIVAETLSTPAGDGAWIVKNSWGSSSEDFPNSNRGNGWGVDGSGYFYISYYDMSAKYFETYDFAVTEEEKSTFDYKLVFENDFMPVSDTQNSTTVDKVSMANVFASDQLCKVSDLSCQTSTPGTHVKYELYLLDGDSTDPTDGTLAATAEADYTYGGFHRVELDQPVYISAGQAFAVVVTETVKVQGQTQYSLNFNESVNELYAKANNMHYWVKGVINEGESYLGVAGSDGMRWTDWADFITALKATNYSNTNRSSFDNFCIKAYATPVEEEVAASTTAVSCGQTAQFTCKAYGVTGACSYQWQWSKDGSTWKDCELEGAHTGTYSVNATARRAGYQYRCVVTAPDGNVMTSDPLGFDITLKSTASTVPVAEGDVATFTCNVKGSGEYSVKYQWYYSKDGGLTWRKSTMPGSKTSKLQVQATASRLVADQQYKCAVTVGKCWSCTTNAQGFIAK